jgi:hypothetical protein
VDDAGTCPGCARTVRLTPARGLIRTHVSDGERCPGTGRQPAPPAPDADWLTRFAALPIWAVPAALGLVAVVCIAAALVVRGTPPAATASQDRAGIASARAAASSSAAEPVGQASSLTAAVPAPAAVPPAAVPDLSPAAVESLFLAGLAEAGLGFAGDGDAALELARVVCRSLDGGVGFRDLAETLVARGATYAEAGSFIGRSTAAFCPAHTSGNW